MSDDDEPAQVCRGCGCSDPDPCNINPDPFTDPIACSWVEPDLCSGCLPAEAAEPQPLLYDAGGRPLVFR